MQCIEESTQVPWKYIIIFIHPCTHFLANVNHFFLVQCGVMHSDNIFLFPSFLSALSATLFFTLFLVWVCVLIFSLLFFWLLPFPFLCTALPLFHLFIYSHSFESFEYFFLPPLASLFWFPFPTYFSLPTTLHGKKWNCRRHHDNHHHRGRRHHPIIQLTDLIILTYSKEIYYCQLNWETTSLELMCSSLMLHLCTYKYNFLLRSRPVKQCRIDSYEIDLFFCGAK